MFADLIRRLTSPNADRLPDPEARVALAALMVRVARADGHYSAPEAACIDSLLAERHGLTRQQAAAIRSDAEVLEAEAPDTVRFTRAIKDAVALEDRGEVVEGLWSVALADGERDAHEDGVLRLVANLLGINDRDSALARQRAATRRSDG